MKLRRRLLVGLEAGGFFLSGIARGSDIGLLASDAYQPRFQYIPPFEEIIPIGGFNFGIGLEAVYDSNFFLEESGGSDEFALAVVPSIRYISDADNSAMAWFEFDYSPALQTYFNNSELTNFQNNFRGSFNLRGSRTEIELYARYNELSGGDRLAEGYAEGYVLNVGLVGTYQVAARTSIGANFGYATSHYDTGQEGAETYTAGISANWAYSERLSFGPYLRYTASSSDAAGSRDAYAFLIQANYMMRERIHLTGSIGVEKADDLGLTGDLNAVYAITERAHLSASVRYATVPSPSSADYFVQDLTVSTKLTRQFTYGIVGVGVNWSSSFYEEADGSDAGDDRGDNNYTSFVLTYERPLFSERVQMESSVQYAMNRGDRDYGRWLVSVGLRMDF